MDRRVGRPRRRRLRRVQPSLRPRLGGAVLEGLADSQRFADGRIAQGPIAACEVQGYVYDAKLRTAELAREVLGDAELAKRLEREAAELRERFDRAFWIERHGGFYALALDGEKAQVDSRCSNMGHLLWSGIVPAARVAGVARTLLDEPLWSGWGVRTMSAVDEAYRPLAYHRGTVWPHDNSLIAHGLALRGERDAALQILRSMLEAAPFFDGGLPEVFAGLPAGIRRSPSPIRRRRARRRGPRERRCSCCASSWASSPMRTSARSPCAPTAFRRGWEISPSRACRRSGSASTCGSGPAARRSSRRPMIRTGGYGDKTGGLTLLVRARVTDNSGGALAPRQGEAFNSSQRGGPVHQVGCRAGHAWGLRRDRSGAGAGEQRAVGARAADRTNPAARVIRPRSLRDGCASPCSRRPGSPCRRSATAAPKRS